MTGEPGESVEEIDVDEAATSTVDRRNGAVALDRRTIVRILLSEPVARNYAIAALAGLGIVFMVLLEVGGDLSAIGGLAVVILGVGGIVLHWRAAPFFILLILTYFMWTPFGSPYAAEYNYFRGKVQERRFQFLDVVVVLAVLVYLMSHFRLAGLLAHAIAREGTLDRSSDPMLRRPLAHVRPTEFGNMLVFATLLVVVGQLAWLFVSGFEVAPNKPIPLKLADHRPYVDSERFMPLGASRFFILVGVLLAGTLLSRLVFGYWRLRTLDRGEAQMILMDESWRETSRERSRLEIWRRWARQRTEKRAKLRR